MTPTPKLTRTTRQGIPGWLDVTSNRWWPIIAGAEEPTAEEKAKADAEKAAADAKAAEDKAVADAAAAKKDTALTDADRAALEAVVEKERKARRDAEKASKDAQKKLDEIEAASLSETEKLKKEAEDGKQAAVKATDKLRRANLIGALSDKGLTGSRAKAAARLLDDVTYDDDDEPTNLDDAIKAASKEFGADQFKPNGRAAAVIDSGGGGGGGGEKPNLTADELAMAKSFGMTPEEYAKHK